MLFVKMVWLLLVRMELFDFFNRSRPFTSNIVVVLRTSLDFMRGSAHARRPERFQQEAVAKLFNFNVASSIL